MTDSKLDWPAAVHKILRDEGIPRSRWCPTPGIRD